MKTKITVMYTVTKITILVPLIFSMVVTLSGILLLIATSHVKGVHMINVLCGLITFVTGAALTYKNLVRLIAILMGKQVINL